MVRIEDEILENLEWKKMRITQEALNKLLKSKKVIWLETIGYPNFIEGLLIYLEGKRTIEILEVGTAGNEDGSDCSFLEIQRTTLKKSLVKII